jgi:hypothetical protein
MVQKLKRYLGNLNTPRGTRHPEREHQLPAERDRRRASPVVRHAGKCQGRSGLRQLLLVPRPINSLILPAEDTWREVIRLPKKVVRDAGTGRFVPKKEADRRPKTTVTEKVPVRRPKKSK